MYLSKLEIVGFKSFAQKTDFIFKGGISCFVGPNGCGKTNVVDAIRWVLGEQKTSVLRSDLMENVIFNGTSARKPLGMSEVSMTLLNNKGILPTEYNDITITRRLFRNGESNYLINNTQCLLRDIVDLFMDTGMGADSYSVIELKMVEAILSGKAEERRQLFEEAAGVKKYKHRRKEAGKKLISVQTDLVRIYDILQEIQKNVNTLSRQASKTKRYNKLLEELRNLEVNLLKHEFADIKSVMILIDAELERLRLERSGHETSVAETEEHVAVIKNNLTITNARYQDARNNENFLNSAIAQKNKDAAISNEKILALGNAQLRLREDIGESEQNIVRTEQAGEDAKSAINAKEKQLELFSADLEKLTKNREETQSIVNKMREDLTQVNEEVINLQNKTVSIGREADGLNVRKTDLQEKINSNENQRKSLTNNIQQFEEESKATESARAEFEITLDRAEKELALKQELQAHLSAQLETHRTALSDKKNELTAKTATLDFLNGLIDTEESSKYLLSEKQWDMSEKLLLGEACGIDENYRIAVNSALGEASRYFVVDTKEQAYSAIKLLKDSQKGRAAFICREMIPDIPASALKSNSTDGVIGLVSELIRTDDKLKNALRAILGDMLLVESTEAGWNAINNNEAESAVTLDGEIIRAKGIIRGGSRSKTEGQIIGKRERIAKLSKEVVALTKEIEDLEAKIQGIKDELSEIDLRQLNDDVRNAQLQLNKNQQKITEIVYKIENLNNSYSMIEKSIAETQQEIESINKLLGSLEQENGQLTEKLATARQLQSDKQNELKSAEQKLNAAESDYRSAEMEMVKLNEELKNLQREIERLTAEKSSLQLRIENRNKEIQSNDAEIAELKDKLVILEEDIAETSKLSAEAATKRSFIETEISSLQEQMDQHSAELHQKHKALEKATDNLHQQELKLNELQTRLENVISRAQEGYEIDLDNIDIIIEEEFSIEDSKTTVHDLKDKLNQLGSVNFMALDEYDQQNERLQFYESQINDLKDSEKNLQETISEINQTAVQQFMETFDRINENFQMLFKKLFGEEGQSSLRLAEGDPLEADIEIMAKPPSKKPNSIEALSGGEKTLTAIALLFGIYLVKPSPFCILDEVDAPLDDTNIGRFVDMIREFSKSTQFLIVTHNKKTMEAGDSLYGITMQEEGVSKVVSVRLQQEENQP